MESKTIVSSDKGVDIPPTPALAIASIIVQIRPAKFMLVKIKEPVQNIQRELTDASVT